MRAATFGLLAALAMAGCSSNDGQGTTECPDCGMVDGDDLAPAATGDWSSYRGGTYRTGYGAESEVGVNVEVAWSVPNFNERDWTAVKSSGAVWGDVLYFPSDEGTMYAFDRMTGDEVWSRQLIDRSPGIHSTPDVTAGVVYIGTYAGNLHALDRETGEELWRYRIGNVIGSSPVYVPEDDAVYVSHETPREEPHPGGGYVTKNDPRTGEEIWVSPKLHHWPHASVAVDPERDVVIVGANDGVLHGYSTETGEELWSHDFESDAPGEADIKTTAAISREHGWGILGTWDRNVYAVDLLTGEIVWSFTTNGSMQGSPAIDEVNGRVFQGAGGSGETMFALDLETGEKIWGAAIGGVSSSPAISGDRSRVVVGSNDNKVVSLNAETGEVVWEFEADGPVSSSPVLVGDMIYFAARFGSLYALRTTP